MAIVIGMMAGWHFECSTFRKHIISRLMSDVTFRICKRAAVSPNEIIFTHFFNL